MKGHKHMMEKETTGTINHGTQSRDVGEKSDILSHDEGVSLGDSFSPVFEE